MQRRGVGIADAQRMRGDAILTFPQNMRGVDIFSERGSERKRELVGVERAIEPGPLTLHLPLNHGNLKPASLFGRQREARRSKFC